jgi:hypothetical protein
MGQGHVIDLTVVVPPTPGTTVPLVPTAAPRPQPQQGRPPGLAFTGLDAGLLLLLALALVLIGLALHRLGRQRPAPATPLHVAVRPPTAPPTRDT